MALIIHFPDSFKIGDTTNCVINGEPAQVQWTDAKTLTILPDDRRVIEQRKPSGDGLVLFLCSSTSEPEALAHISVAASEPQKPELLAYREAIPRVPVIIEGKSYQQDTCEYAEDPKRQQQCGVPASYYVASQGNAPFPLCRRHKRITEQENNNFT
jgi:hypothetical protein